MQGLAARVPAWPVRGMASAGRGWDGRGVARRGVQKGWLHAHHQQWPDRQHEDTDLGVADPAEDVRGRTVVDANGDDIGKVWT